LKPGTEGSFLSATRTNAQFNVNLISERDFYRSQAVLADQLLSLIIVVALIVGIGAAFGGMNTMYSSVEHRSGELAVLRALGFGRIQILVSFLLESLFIAVGGGIVGTSLAMAVFYGTHLESRQLKIGTAVFSSRIDWPTIFAGLTSAVLIGIAGGLLPAWRAGRIEVLEALRKV
jgi:putative ABC transport system permease protein